MKTRELRIGNYVHEETLGNIKVVAFLEADIWVMSKAGNEYHVRADAIDPVPMSDFWFDFFGFEPGEEQYIMYVDEWLTICVDALDYSICLKDNYGQVIAPTIHVKYVHQLQNLYFALTGKEL